MTGAAHRYRPAKSGREGSAFDRGRTRSVPRASGLDTKTSSVEQRYIGRIYTDIEERSINRLAFRPDHLPMIALG